MDWPGGGRQQAGLGLLWQVLIPSLHEGQNPLVIASEGARSPTGRSAPPLGRWGRCEGCILLPPPYSAPS
jgi:hypothetical protein